MTIGTDGGVSASLRYSKTDTGNTAVCQGVLLAVLDPWTGNVVVQEAMNHTTKWLWPESEKEIADGERRVAGGEAMNSTVFLSIIALPC